MTSKFDQFSADALKLPPRDRAILAERLIASLDSADETGNEFLWLEEAERRYQAYKRGEISSSPVNEVLARIRSALE